jgi:hypothetical protein
LQDSSGALLVEFSIQQDKITWHDVQGVGPRFCRMGVCHRLVVKVWDSPVRHGVRPYVWVLIDLHDLKVSGGWGRADAQGWFGWFATVLRRSLVSDRGLIQIASEDACRNWCLTRCQLHMLVCCLVTSPCDVVELKAVELVFQEADHLALCHHLGVMRA